MPSAEIRRGELWRLFTSVFLHIDILHLVFNVYWLWLFGTLVEQTFGHAKTLLLLTFFAFGSSSFEFAFDRGGVGLSGIGYGLFGFLWVLSRFDDRFRGAMPSRTIALFVAWFFLCVAATLAHVYEVGNIAHASGAVFGALTGFAIGCPNRRWIAAAGLGVLATFGLWGCTAGRPYVSLSKYVGYDEAKWGYDALLQQQNKNAIRWLKDAAKMQPRLPEVWFDLGIAYARVGNTTASRDAYKRAHDLDPDNADYTAAYAESRNSR